MTKNQANLPAENTDSEGIMESPFLQHLEELRWRLIKSAVAIIAAAIPCMVYWRKIFDALMLHPLSLAKDPKPELITTTPAEVVLFSIKIALFSGVILAVPVVFYQIWSFVAPGLYKKEKAVILPVVFASTIFFLLGAGFSYYVIPYVIKFLAEYGENTFKVLYTAQEYLSFILKLTLSFGVVFELPVASYVLTKLGLITPRFLIDKIRYAIVAIFILAALLTPPDLFSQVVLGVPLLFLYGVSIVVSYFVVKSQRRNES